MSEERITRRGVVTGYGWNNKDQELAVVAEIQGTLEGNALAGNEHYYLRKEFGSAVVGGIYTWDTDSTSWYPGSVKYVGSYADQDKAQVIQWAIKAQVHSATRDARRLEKKEATRNLIRETMAPLNQAYWSTNVQGKRALEVLVLEALRSTSLD